ncbi:MAG TPA: copper amine oxidase N-terminal domain-containing protein [Bacillota bacterium]|nr:copper amine oxidase N-terminal domain-containing protein [Peptococcaceae bacterium MAG4]NLW38541.1 copper amine oxidase N-terminal domain-containing protein [Peptococcaceae bacterium]HPZ43041.1 copper amine oxidase N-terminal domain-containing protein [Bacillota bacterium]HQD75570.1 copper amine oxidase N-terminal domain-containing protein [Bacillota bacterium]HUM57815.1 copper amine oxidase N-terminal domain-containing protein [Bacillota bacterium]
MKKGKIGLLLLCFILCLSVVYTAAAETPLQAKQLLLDKLKKWDPRTAGELYNTSSGTVSYTIKELDGLLVSDEPLKSLAGAQLKVKYGFHVPEEKLAAKYELTLKQGQYRGEVYLDTTRLILTQDVLSLLKLFDPEFDTGAAEPLPQYLYLSDPEIAQIWENIAINSEQEIPPELRELLAFLLEAVPGQYFTTSLINQKVILSLDQEGLEDVLLQILQKVKNEDERFAELIAGLLTAYAPGENKADIKRDILDSLEESIQDSSFNESKDEIQELLKNVTINQLSWEIPLLPGGESKFNLDLAFDTSGMEATGEAEALRGRIKVEALVSGPADNKTGTYSIVFDIRDAKNLIFEGQVDGKYRQTDKEANSYFRVRVLAGDSTGANTYLKLLLEGQSEVKAEQNLQINIPVLTETNSVNLVDYLNKPTGISVLVDGMPVHFDVDPFIKDDRTIVPLRNLAETLGFEVTWTEPDRIDLKREDISITMYIGNPVYIANGIEKTLDVPPFIKDGRTMVPLRFIAEEFGCQVDYDEATKTVFITR